MMLCLASVPSIAQERDEAINVAKRAVQFLTEEVSTRGGYVWRYSSDLTLREGEGKITTETVWVQPPGTPAVGEAFLELHLATGDGQFLEAARKAGEILLKGQMRSGGWQAMIELEPTRRRRWAYRVDRLTSGA
ncbi:MAG: pectic acid lyase, partial [Planctomycetota bacterium]